MKYFYLLIILFACRSTYGQDIEWNYSFGGSKDDIPTAVISTSDDGFVIAGYSNSTDGDVTGNHGENDYWIVKLNNLGILQWQKSLGGSRQHDYAYAVIEK